MAQAMMWIAIHERLYLPVMKITGFITLEA